MRRSEEERAKFMADCVREQIRKQTPAERVMKGLLEPLGFKFQVWKVGKTKNGGVHDYLLDCFHPGSNLCVEVDGGIHKKQKGRDRRRTNQLGYAEGIRVIRFENRRVLACKKGVFVNHEMILQEIREAMGDG
jgi:very-short-patch-repair endonuclease